MCSASTIELSGHKLLVYKLKGSGAQYQPSEMAEHNFRDYFQIVVEDGKEKAECTLCGRVIVNNVGCLRMHYMKVHEREPLPSRPRRAEDIECSEDDDEPSYASDTECGDAVERILKYLAVCTGRAHLTL